MGHYQNIAKFPCTKFHLSWKCHEIRSSVFRNVANRQTDTQTYIHTYIHTGRQTDWQFRTFLFMFWENNTINLASLVSSSQGTHVILCMLYVWIFHVLWEKYTFWLIEHSPNDSDWVYMISADILVWTAVWQLAKATLTQGLYRFKSNKSHWFYSFVTICRLI